MKTHIPMAFVLLVVIITGLIWWVTSQPRAEQVKVADVHSKTTALSKSTSPQNVNASSLLLASDRSKIVLPNFPPTIKLSTNNEVSVSADAQKADVALSSPFRYVLGPVDGLKKVNAALGIPSAQANGPPSTDLQIRPPIAVYELSADELTKGATLDSAHLTRYRYRVEAAGKPIMYAEVYNDPKANGGHAMTSSGGPNQGAIARALEELASSEQTHGVSYEVRILGLLHVLNSTSVTVLWLKSDNSGADLIYVLPPTWPPFETGNVYNSEEFLKIVRSKAQERTQAAPSPAQMGHSFSPPM